MLPATDDNQRKRKCHVRGGNNHFIHGVTGHYVDNLSLRWNGVKLILFFSDYHPYWCEMSISLLWLCDPKTSRDENNTNQCEMKQKHVVNIKLKCQIPRNWGNQPKCSYWEWHYNFTGKVIGASHWYHKINADRIAQGLAWHWLWIDVKLTWISYRQGSLVWMASWKGDCHRYHWVWDAYLILQQPLCSSNSPLEF